MNRGGGGTVLVTGASIAGPALAYWLTRYGFEVTLVERAATIRTGGYAIDIRGTAIDVVERMGNPAGSARRARGHEPGHVRQRAWPPGRQRQP